MFTVLKVARLPDMLSERLHARYEVLECSESGAGLDALKARGIRAMVANGESRVGAELIGRLPKERIAA